MVDTALELACRRWFARYRTPLPYYTFLTDDAMRSCMREVACHTDKDWILQEACTQEAAAVVLEPNLFLIDSISQKEMAVSYELDIPKRLVDG